MAGQTGVFDQNEIATDLFEYQQIGYDEREVPIEWLNPIGDVPNVRSRIGRFLDRAVEEVSE